MRVVTLIAAILTIVAATACKSSKKASPPPPRVQLAIDPDNPPEVEGWWSNGREIACVHHSGLYVILPYPDPEAAPVEYGRWSRDSYAFIWLEPYNSPEYEKVRADQQRAMAKVALASR